MYLSEGDLEEALRCTMKSSWLEGLVFCCCCLLFVVCCLLFVVCCLLFVVCCLLFVVCCLLFVVGVVICLVYECLSCSHSFYSSSNPRKALATQIYLQMNRPDIAEKEVRQMQQVYFHILIIYHDYYHFCFIISILLPS